MKKKLVLAGLLTAMMVFTTAYILHIPTVGGGYVHLGDTVLYLAASLLPAPYAVAVGAIGGALADLLSGAAVWAVPTLIIKGVMVIPFTAKNERILCRRNGWAPLLAGLIGVAGYFVAEAAILLLSGASMGAAVSAALLAAPFNGVQELVSGIAYILLAAALDRLRIKPWLTRL